MVIGMVVMTVVIARFVHSHLRPNQSNSVVGPTIRSILGRSPNPFATDHGGVIPTMYVPIPPEDRDP